MGARVLEPLLDVHGPYPADMKIINPYAFVSGGGGFVPTDIAGCMLWLDASQIVGFNTGDLLTAWDDESGEANDPTFPGGLYPTYRTNIVNSLPAVEFDGVNDFGNVALALSRPFTAFIVFEALNGNAGRVLSGETNGGGNNWLLGTHAGHVGNHFANGWVYEASTWDNSWHVSAAVDDTGSSQVYLDGADVTVNSTPTGLPGASIGIGAAGDGLEPAKAYIAEVIIYDTALNTPHREAVEAYLATKYGL